MSKDKEVSELTIGIKDDTREVIIILKEASNCIGFSKKMARELGESLIELSDLLPDTH